MRTVVELQQFVREAERVGMTEAERFDLVTMLARAPKAGDVMQGTGGVRKLRFAAQGRGKSGSYRVVTFFHPPEPACFSDHRLRQGRQGKPRESRTQRIG